MILISDIDGCLTPGRFQPVDIPSMALFKEFIKKNNVFMVLASGRSQAYMECLSQILGINTPYICENGAAIFAPKTGNYIYTFSKVNISKIKNSLELKFGARVIYEPNKEFTISLRIDDASFESIEREYEAVMDLLKDYRDIEITHSNSAIDIIPKGANKQTALKFLCKNLGIKEEKLIGFGDSYNDLCFLDFCRLTGAPSNCCEDVAKAVNYKAKNEDIKGLLEFLNEIRT